MITKPTVFVLGAGVSMPYGFPSGTQLIREICGATAGIDFNDTQPGHLEKGQITKILHDVFGEMETEEFGKALYYSQRYSIDAFLERRPEFSEIGKWAIALFIFRKEINANLFSFENQDQGCYRYLFDKLDTSWDTLESNKVSFITFNYDRSLEHFLSTTFQKTFGKNEHECAKAISSIPIIHVHGSLGKLPWQAKDGIPYSANMESYSQRNDKGNVAKNATVLASKQIKVIPESRSTSEEFEDAFKLLSQAERIYFLGFGYHPINLERLQLLNVPKVKESRDSKTELITLRGTGKGLEEAEKKSVYDKWSIRIIDTSCDSLLFLRRYAHLD
jgi:hypothetical protein